MAMFADLMEARDREQQTPARRPVSKRAARPTPPSPTTTASAPALPAPEAAIVAATTPAPAPQLSQPVPLADPTFDLTTPADKTNTYSFSKDELWAINDMVQELDRQYDIQVTRYNVIRLAVHQLVEDYRRNKEQSFVFQRLRHPRT